jgi:hypothetical protein
LILNLTNRHFRCVGIKWEVEEAVRRLIRATKRMLSRDIVEFCTNSGRLVTHTVVLCIAGVSWEFTAKSYKSVFEDEVYDGSKLRSSPKSVAHAAAPTGALVVEFCIAIWASACSVLGHPSGKDSLEVSYCRKEETYEDAYSK